MVESGFGTRGWGLELHDQLSGEDPGPSDPVGPNAGWRAPPELVVGDAPELLAAGVVAVGVVAGAAVVAGVV